MILTALVLFFSLSTSVFAANTDNRSLSKEEIKKINQEFKKHAKELEVTEQEPYKEVKLENGNIIYRSIEHKVYNNHTQQDSKDLAASQVTTTAADNQQSASITSKNGYKNAIGKFYTKWILQQTGHMISTK